MTLPPLMLSVTKMEVPEKLRQFINEAREPLPPITDIDESLHLDSLAMMKLVSFMESEIGYTVEDDELTLQNFESLRTVGQMLEGKGAKIGQINLSGTGVS